MATSYTVEKYAEKDDAGYVAKWKDRLHHLLPFTTLTTVATYWVYVAFRVRCTVAAQRIRHTVYPISWIFLAIEVGVACELLIVLGLFVMDVF